MDAGVNFIDAAGNMHLDLGDFSRTVLGRAEARKGRERQPMTAAQVQLLFLFATRPEAASLTVRELAIEAGVSKSNAAQVRQQFLETSVISKSVKAYHFHLSKDTEALLQAGYTQVLRPKLVIGRFRSPEPTSESFLKNLSSEHFESYVGNEFNSIRVGQAISRRGKALSFMSTMTHSLNV